MIAIAAAIPVLLVLAWGLGALSSITGGRRCPVCGSDTTPIKMRGIQRVLASSFSRRWCTQCGWEGLRRKYARRTAAMVAHQSGFRWKREEDTPSPLLWKDNGAEGDPPFS